MDNTIHVKAEIVNRRARFFLIDDATDHRRITLTGPTEKLWNSHLFGIKLKSNK
jgi:hypothetical protein